MKDGGSGPFGKLTREQAERLVELIDESALCRRPSADALRRITGPGFTDDELYELAMLYLSFMLGPDYGTWREDAERTGLPDDKRRLYEDIARKVHAGVDNAKLQEYTRLQTAMLCGHSYIHSIKTFTEFRPISGKNGIAHLVPYLVLDGTLHDNSSDTDRQLRLQLSPFDAKSLAEDITEGMDVLAAQIAEMRKRFGDDAVHD